MKRTESSGSRAATALLLFLLLVVAACAPDEARVATGALEETTGSMDATAEPTTGTIEASRMPSDPPTQIAEVSQRATPENVKYNSTYIDHPATNGNPDAFVTVRQARGAEGGDYGQAIGVWYDRFTEGGRWAVFNQDEEPMRVGASFDVAILDGSGYFVHRATEENSEDDRTYLDDKLVNGDPDANLSITQNWNPGGGAGTYNRHTIDVDYSESRERWVIFNEDGSSIPRDAAFNVVVEEEGPANEIARAPDVTNNGVVDYAPAEDPNSASGDSQGFPEYEYFYSENDDAEVRQPESGGGSAGSIPNVKPFNFGRDPGGPEDKTLYLSVPKIGLEGIPVYNSTSEEDLRASAVHVPATGFPWQEGANVYIAAHRIGYPGTGSDHLFYDLDLVVAGDEILLTDAAGDTYVYRVTEQKIVDQDNVAVMDTPDDGSSIVTLQSCTLPDYAKRLIVQADLVESSA